MQFEREMPAEMTRMVVKSMMSGTNRPGDLTKKIILNIILKLTIQKCDNLFDIIVNYQPKHQNIDGFENKSAI